MKISEQSATENREDQESNVSQNMSVVTVGAQNKTTFHISPQECIFTRQTFLSLGIKGIFWDFCNKRSFLLLYNFAFHCQYFPVSF